MRLWQALLRDLRNSWTDPPFWTLDRPLLSSTAFRAEQEKIENDFEAYVHHVYKGNGVVFACILVRLLVFSEARFQWRRFREGRPAGLWGDRTLSLLERPWPNGTTGELLAHMEQDGSMAGNFFATVVQDDAGRRIRRMRPDWVTIITGSPTDDPFDLRAGPVSYVYEPKPGTGRVSVPQLLDAQDVTHYSPIPDPVAQWRGMSWLTPVLRETQADSAATKHKLQFFRRGATPGFAIAYDKDVPKEKVEQYIELFREQHEGADNAYRTLHLGGGADAKSLGADLRQLDFKSSQGHGETRIAAAAGVHPVIVGLSEGMQGSALNAGNYGQARRRFADGTMRPLWRIAAASLETLLPDPGDGSQLWYDDRDVAFLREDAKDGAQIQRIRASTINGLISAGYTPESAVEAVQNDDLALLEHTGLVSVQLQKPGADDGEEPVEVPANLAPTLLADGWRIVPQQNGHRRPTAAVSQGGER